MYSPDFKKFEKLTAQGNLIPVYRDILADTDTPVSAYMKIERDNSFLFESVLGGEKWARYSFIGVSPSKIIKSGGDRVEIIENGEISVRNVDTPMDVLRDELLAIVPVEIPGLPRFYGGLVGFIGYESVRFFERVPVSDKPSLNLPDLCFMVMDTILVFDNLKQVIKIISNVHMSGRSAREAYDEAVSKIDSLADLLRKPKELRKISFGGEQQETTYVSSFKKQEEFIKAVDKSIEYIKAGDIFQVVLSQRLEAENRANPFDIYRALRMINPSPYMFYLNTENVKMIGSSPEILVRLEGDKVTLRPIAGTRKRGETEEKDAEMEAELRADKKENAEHIMLVDLGRNDVGRVAEMGSIEVTDFMIVEKYSHVMHLVSNVEGLLKEGLDAFDVLKACFPAGTVTGAPKVRAMEIIDELEPVGRGPYAGAVGYFGYSGNMDVCITIRTIIVKDDKVYVQAGAGIVADSIPEMEFKETMNKARGMLKALEMAGKV